MSIVIVLAWRIKFRSMKSNFDKDMAAGRNGLEGMHYGKAGKGKQDRHNQVRAVEDWILELLPGNCEHTGALCLLAPPLQGANELSAMASTVESYWITGVNNGQPLLST
jgi:hypothetical protein